MDAIKWLVNSASRVGISNMDFMPQVTLESSPVSLIANNIHSNPSESHIVQPNTVYAVESLQNNVDGIPLKNIPVVSITDDESPSDFIPAERRKSGINFDGLKIDHPYTTGRRKSKMLSADQNLQNRRKSVSPLPEANIQTRRNSISPLAESNKHSQKSSAREEHVDIIQEKSVCKPKWMRSTNQSAVNVLLTLGSLCHNDRKLFLYDMLIECTSSEIWFLKELIPFLHRDFVVLLPRTIVHRILTYLHPKELFLCTLVSKKWKSILDEHSLWEALLRNIGLESMIHVIKSQKSSAKKCKIFLNFLEWSSGKLSYRSFQAHHLGILSMWHYKDMIATGSVDRTCKIYRLSDFTLLYSLCGHENSVTAVFFDSKRFITASADSTIKMWSPSGKLLDTLTGHSDKITCFKYHNDKLISGSQDTQLRIWDLQSMKCIRKLNAHTNGITCIDSNGILIASGDMYGNFILWHFGSGNMLGKYGFKDSFVHLIDDFIQADPDTIQYLHLNDDLLLVGTLQGTSFLFELEDVKDSLDYLLETWTSNGLFIKRKLDTNVRWTMNGVADPWKVIVTTTTGKIYVYNHKSAKLLYVLSDGKETAFTKVISNEGNVITCGSDGIVRCWRIGSSL